MEYNQNPNYSANKEAKALAMKFMRRVKKNSRCIKCGESRPWVLDFHHRDPKNKIMSVYKMVKLGWSIHLIKKELKKCDCLCANDHRDHHNRKYWLR